MSQVVRYFHIRCGEKGGATVKVVGDTEMVGQVDVQYSVCSKKDNFCKKIGRSLADKAPTKIVALRYLPRELDFIAKDKVGSWHFNHDFAIKYFLPKD